MSEEFEVALTEPDEASPLLEMAPAFPALDVMFLLPKTLCINGTAAYNMKMKSATVRLNATNLVNFAMAKFSSRDDVMPWQYHGCYVHFFITSCRGGSRILGKGGV